MIHRTTREQIREYFADPRVGQSQLKTLAYGVDSFNQSLTDKTEGELFYEEKEHFIVGSAVDCKLMQFKEAFEQEYYVFDAEKPGEKVMSIIHDCFDRVNKEMAEGDFLPESLLEIQEHLTGAIEAAEYYPKWGMPKKIENVVKFDNYYQALRGSLGKQILSLDQFATIQLIENSVRDNPETGWYFQDNEGIDFYYQHIIYFDYGDVECKALLDILVVDHINKTIFVMDFKTLFEYVINFPSSMRKRRYDFQVGFYTIAAEKWRLTIPELANYQVTNPGFIVETTKPGAQGKASIFECTAELMNIAVHGRRFYEIQKSNNSEEQDVAPMILSRKIFGINELIQLYKWHTEHGFSKDKVVVESGNNLLLNWEGIDYENSAR